MSTKQRLVIMGHVLFLLAPVWLMMWAMPPPAEAQAKADSLSIESATVYRHLIEENDMLMLVHYDITYASLPTERASDLYLLRLMDGGDQLAIDVPYPFGDQRGFNEGVGGFYWAASGTQPTWGGAYDVVLQGNPLVWPDVEDWKETLTLGASNYSSFDTQSENQLYLYLSILSIAESIEADWSETLVATGSLGDVLNETGSAYFARAIPALPLMCPTVFSVSESWPNWPTRTWSREYATEIADDAENTPIGALVTIIARNTNMTYTAAGTVFVFICFAVVVFLTYSKAKGQGDEGILVGLPVLMIGVRLGLLSMSIWAVYALFSVMLVGYVLFFRHG